MPRKLDQRQQADLSAFVNALFTEAGYTSTAEWARDSGYPAPNLSNLRNRKGAVDGYNLLRLIRAAAERAGQDPVDLAARLAAGDHDVADRLRAVEEGLTELAGEVRTALQDAAARVSAASPPGKSQGGREG
jgi:hypothetical protein